MLRRVRRCLGAVHNTDVRISPKAVAACIIDLQPIVESGDRLVECGAPDDHAKRQARKGDAEGDLGTHKSEA